MSATESQGAAAAGDEQSKPCEAQPATRSGIEFASGQGMARLHRTAAFSVTTFGVRNTSNSVRCESVVLVLNRLPK